MTLLPVGGRYIALDKRMNLNDPSPALSMKKMRDMFQKACQMVLTAFESASRTMGEVCERTFGTNTTSVNIPSSLAAMGSYLSE